MLKANKTRAVFFHVNTPLTALYITNTAFFITAVKRGGYAQ